MEKQEVLWVSFPPACRQAGFSHFPLFPQFYTFLSGRIFLSSREFPVEIIFLGLSAVALSTSLFPVFLSYERLPVFLVGISGKAL
jgi:hypothetical protein